MLLHERDLLRADAGHDVFERATGAKLEPAHLHFEPGRAPPGFDAILRGPQFPDEIQRRCEGALQVDAFLHFVLLFSFWVFLFLRRSQFGAESIEARRLPVRADARDPLVEFVERLGSQRIEALLPLGPDFHETRAIEDAEMARHAGLLDVHALDEFVD